MSVPERSLLAQALVEDVDNVLSHDVYILCGGFDPRIIRVANSLEALFLYFRDDMRPLITSDISDNDFLQVVNTDLLSLAKKASYITYDNPIMGSFSFHYFHNGLTMHTGTNFCINKRKLY